VRNIEACPRVRVKVASWPRTRWLAGTARILEDDPREVEQKIAGGNLARRLCVRAASALDTSRVAVLIDLDGGN
jgi:hypothetical protein